LANGAGKVQTLLGQASIIMTMDVYGRLSENAEQEPGCSSSRIRICWLRRS